MSRRAAVRAPALVGRRWAGGGDLPLPLRMSGVGAPLGGRVVVLHFFTAGCVSCAHAHAELRALAAARPRALVLGVHSPKFPHEATREGLDAAIVRASLDHPVLDDADHETWSAYAVGAWPTIVVVDAGGYAAQTFVGEGHRAEMEALVGELLGEAVDETVDAGGPGDDPAPPLGRATLMTGRALSSPASALALPGGRVVVADPGNHRLVVLDAAAAVAPGVEPLSVIGGFDEPAGMTLLPPDVAARVGWDLAVADAGAHTVVGVALAGGSAVTVAGTGEPLSPDAPEHERGGPALASGLSSPMDVAWCAGVLVVAMSGVHQLWALDVAADPGDGRLAVIAGSGSEGLLDGVGGAAMLAQPSALAADERGPDPGGHGLWFVDAESSSLRHVRPPASGPDGLDGAWEVTTVVGTGVHAFGARDGGAASALLQHPLGVSVAADGAVLVADTYNGAVRRVDVEVRQVTTVVDGLAEPVAVVTRGRRAGDEPEGSPHELLVVESAAHRLTSLTIAPAEVLPAGPVDVTVGFVVPAGQRLDDADGSPRHLSVRSFPPTLLTGLVAGEPQDEPATWTTRVSLAPGSGVLVVSARVATCDARLGAIPAGAACHVHQRTWHVPVVVRRADPAVATSTSTPRVELRSTRQG